ncbi:hypothetical protein IWX90DRAFT_482828 [Phyllosticta citrichinensis]|uniref:Uncharacterized protein n=1 Tax=Phyllosticta citrichinensis TaxID=1130410 RepID=A0ABR1Y7I3_9PEZI
MATSYSSTSTSSSASIRTSTSSDEDTTMSDVEQSESQQPLPSTLHRLPLELREKIYEYALRSSTTIWWPPNNSTLPVPGAATALLTTNHTIYAEAAPILYACNRLLFVHPSDANMFVHLTSPDYSRCVTNVCLRIRDRDVRLWSSYLGSALLYRSLQHDFPRLKSLWIFFRSSFWSPRAQDLSESFRRWLEDPALREICTHLEDRVPKSADVRLVCVHRVPREHIHMLAQEVGEDLTITKTGTGEARTAFRKMSKVVNVALELAPIDPVALM